MPCRHSEPRVGATEKRGLGGRALTAKHFIALRESAEAGDLRGMLVREIQRLRITEGGIEPQGADLIRHMLAMHQRHVEELARGRIEPPIPAPNERLAGQRARQRIGLEGASILAEQIARELIQQDDRGEEMVDRAASTGRRALDHRLTYIGKAPPADLVDRRVMDKALPRRDLVQPEMQDFRRAVDFTSRGP